MWIGSPAALPMVSGKPEHEAVDAEDSRRNTGCRAAGHSDSGRRRAGRGCWAARAARLQARAQALRGLRQFIHAASLGESRTSTSQRKPHTTETIPSSKNIVRQPVAWMRKPVAALIQTMVPGLPSMRIALARERSDFVNHRVSSTSMAGKTKPLCRAEKQTVGGQKPEVTNHAGKCGKAAPRQQCPEDEPSRAVAARIGSAGESAAACIRGKKSAPEQRRALAADVKLAGHARRGAEGRSSSGRDRRGCR